MAEKTTIKYEKPHQSEFGTFYSIVTSGPNYHGVPTKEVVLGNTIIYVIKNKVTYTMKSIDYGRTDIHCASIMM